MRQGFWMLAVGLGFWGLAPAEGGQPAAAGGTLEVRSMEVRPLYTAPVRSDIRVDGKLEEWAWETPADQVNSITITAQTFGLQPPPVRSEADLSGRVQFAWDGRDTLYVAAAVRDQSLIPLARPDAMPWSCDSLMVSLQAYGALCARSHPVKTTPWAAHPLFGLSWYSDQTGPRKWTEQTRYVAAKTPDGYAVEAALALRDVGYEVRPGHKLKVSLILVDHDADGKFAQLVQPAAGEGPGFWWDLRLRDDKPYAGEITMERPRVAVGRPIGLTGEIDAFQEGLRLKGVRVKDRQGQTVAALPADEPLPKGRRTLFCGRLTGQALAPGAYQVVSVIEAAGQERNGSVQADVEIVASAEADTGAVGRLPDRYMVPDPKRFAMPSDRRDYKPRTITREDYIKLTEEVFTAKYAAYYKQGRQADLGIWGVFTALPAYALFKARGDRQYLETGLGLIRHTHEANAKQTPAIFWPTQDRIVNLYLNEPAVAAEDKAWLREYLPRLVREVWKGSRPEEWGAMNRSLMWAHFLDIAARRLPEAPEAKTWQAYAELNWQSWWPHRDHWENSSDYNGSALPEYLDWAAWRDPRHLSDAEVVRLVEREMYEVTPAGAFPGYGDAAPWNGSCYHRIPLFERLATVTRDGRFKWAARRLFEYAARQMEDLYSWHLITDGSAGACAWAYLLADDAVAEKAPEQVSRITHRRAFEAVPRDDPLRTQLLQQYGITGVFMRLKEGTTLNKLILRAGADPFAPAAMIELCSDAGHHASTVPNLNYLMAERSVLLCDLAYTERGPEHHNVVFIEDLTGIAPEAKEEAVTVPALAPGRRATYAVVSVDNYKRWPVTNRREVLFTAEGLVVVKDQVTFHQPFVARVRQQWQTREIAPKAGPNWANTYIPWIVNTGLGLGRGFQRWLNPAWDLLIYFTPQADRDYEVYDRSLENIWQALPLRISQRYRGLPEAGKPLHFTTLLWPHKPEPDVEPYARRIRVLRDDPLATVFQVDLSEGRRLLLGVNDTGGGLTGGPVSTDARAFVLWSRMDKEQARPDYLFASGASRFRHDGQVLHESKDKTDVDRSL